jgi:hypothetical protein
MPLRSHPEWSFDAGSRLIVQRIAQEAPTSRPLVIAAESPLNYAIAFHAREILGPATQVVRLDQSPASPAFFITSTQPPAGRVIYVDPAAGVTLSAPDRPVLSGPRASASGDDSP